MPYLGCVFTQTKTDEKGHPLRDHDSTTYVSTFGPIQEFGPLLRRETIRRGLGLARQVVLLLDGAAGLAKMGEDCFRTAIQIVDFYHALEHAGHVLEALLGSKEHPEYASRLSRWARRLLKDQRHRPDPENSPRCCWVRRLSLRRKIATNWKSRKTGCRSMASGIGYVAGSLNSHTTLRMPTKTKFMGHFSFALQNQFEQPA